MNRSLLGAAVLVATATACSAQDNTAPASVSAEQAGRAQLTVDVGAVTPIQGSVHIGVFQGDEAYRADQPVAFEIVPADAATVSATFELEPGEFAIKLFHDVNGDDELNMNMLGIPNEPFGFSNNAPARFGPPGYGATKFTVPEGASQHTITFQ